MKSSLLINSALFVVLYSATALAHDSGCHIVPGLFVIDKIEGEPADYDNLFNKDGRFISLNNAKDSKQPPSLFLYDEKFGIQSFQPLCEGNADTSTANWNDKERREQITCNNLQTGITIEVSMVGYGNSDSQKQTNCKKRLTNDYKLDETDIKSICSTADKKCVVGWSAHYIDPAQGRVELKGTASGGKI